jgi:hypothetical protein
MGAQLLTFYKLLHLLIESRIEREATTKIMPLEDGNFC